MADGDLKLFTSWSGDFARDITRVIRDWLPRMLDRVDPWMSDVDIQAGTRALQVIEDKLNESEFGIIVVTTENQHSTWLNFEAGALSKRFEGRTSRVVPVLVNFDSFYQIEGPIRQFQSIMLTKKLESDNSNDTNSGDDERKVDKESVRELLKAINDVAGTKWPMVEARFEWSWNEFEASILEVIERAGQQPAAPSVSVEGLLKEVLDRIASIERRSTSSAHRLKLPPAPPSTTAEELSEEAKTIVVVGNIMQDNNVGLRRVSVGRTKDGATTAAVLLEPDFDAGGVSRAVSELGELGIGVIFETARGV